MAYLPVVMSIKENGPLSQKDLALAAHVEQPTMAALLDRMERDLLVQREPHPKDKRASLISLTAKAKARIPSAKEGLEDVAEQALSGFSDREKRLLVTLLKRMVSNLDQSSKD
jgi:DNA-binding MarR family transcriptional regulator